MTIGIGITAHPRVQGFAEPVLTKDPNGRWMSLWEESRHGGLGVAVVLAKDTPSEGVAYEAGATNKDNGNYLVLVKAQRGAPVRYFAGAGWSGSGQFKDRLAWERYVKDFHDRSQHPISVQVTNGS